MLFFSSEGYARGIRHVNSTEEGRGDARPLTEQNNAT